MFEDFKLNVGSGGVGVIQHGNLANVLLSINLLWISATRTSVTAARWWTWSPTDSHSGFAERAATYTSSGPSTPTHAAGSSASRWVTKFWALLLSVFALICAVFWTVGLWLMMQCFQGITFYPVITSVCKWTTFLSYSTQKEETACSKCLYPQVQLCILYHSVLPSSCCTGVPGPAVVMQGNGGPPGVPVSHVMLPPGHEISPHQPPGAAQQPQHVPGMHPIHPSG